MNEGRLRTLLREEPVPDAAEAERRGLDLVERAYAERRPERHLVRPRRLAIALAIAALLAALVLSPAGAAVRDWVDDVFTAGVHDAEPALTDLPGGGELLIQSQRGPWTVQAGGSRRLLGHYREATWSPHGLFVAVAEGRTLSAIEPDGTPRWSISASDRVHDPRWSPSGFRIAYRAGSALRVVRADGTRDALVGVSAAVAPAWFPPGPHLLAYVDGRHRVVIAETDADRNMDSVGASPGVVGLGWSAEGHELVEFSRRAAWIRKVRMSKLASSLRLGEARRIPLPAGTVVRAAAFSPRGRTIAILLDRSLGPGPPRSEALLIDPSGGPTRRLFGVSGHLTELAFSPDGRRLLLAWPAADQWLFVPIEGGARLRAIGGVAAAFAPGNAAQAAYPRVEGWCC
jgi:hypothetical protein